jgi:protein SERAC1
VFPATRGIVFLGTPHRGGGKTSLSEIVTAIAGVSLEKTDHTLIQVLERDVETLTRIADAFSQILCKREFTVYSFAEELSISSSNGAERVSMFFDSL